MKFRLTALLLSSTVVGLAQGTLAIRGVTLIDGSGGPPTLNATVVVAGDRIVLIGEGGTLQVSDNSTLVDGRGKTLIPGIMSA